jgi:broad specificity phosphatase PhoE
MTVVALIRHGPTAWNESRRIQGRTDPELSEAGRAAVACWRAPKTIDRFAWVSSPLKRARETARLLHGDTVTDEPRLVEMDWGDWEGRTLDDLRRELGDAMVENEARGLDFMAAGGESPRQVQERLLGWLASVAAADQATAAVSHKGVIRALLSLATGWDMTAPPPTRLDWASAHLFRLDSQGMPSVDRLNLPLDGS